MYEDLIKRLNAYSAEHENHGGITAEAADAIKKLQTIVKLLESDRDIERDLRLAAEEQIPHWHTADEKPPLKVGDEGYNGYLLRVYGYYAVGDYTTDRFGNEEWFHVNGEYEPDVTYWCLLPEPPKEEK